MSISGKVKSKFLPILVTFGFLSPTKPAKRCSVRVSARVLAKGDNAKWVFCHPPVTELSPKIARGMSVE